MLPITDWDPDCALLDPIQQIHDHTMKLHAWMCLETKTLPALLRCWSKKQKHWGSIACKIWKYNDDKIEDLAPLLIYKVCYTQTLHDHGILIEHMDTLSSSRYFIVWKNRSKCNFDFFFRFQKNRTEDRNSYQYSKHDRFPTTTVGSFHEMA